MIIVHIMIQPEDFARRLKPEFTAMYTNSMKDKTSNLLVGANNVRGESDPHPFPQRDCEYFAIPSF